MPFFSVIIPNYNHASFLKERIETVLYQSCRDFEVIILDDNSTDNSKTIIEAYRQHPEIIHIVYNKENSGSPFLQWKKGIELAKADWIWIAESDDWANPDFLLEAQRILNQFPAVGCYYSDSLIQFEGEEKKERASGIKNNFFSTTKWSASYTANGIDELNEYLKYLCTFNNTSAVVFKKEIFTRVQEHVIKYRYYGDWFFFINAMLQTTAYYNQSSLSTYRNHPANYVSSKGNVIETKKEYFRLLQFLLDQSVIKDKQKLIRFFCLHYLGSGWLQQGTGNAVRIIRNYFKMNNRLALKVVPILLWNKITRLQNKKKYP